MHTGHITGRKKIFQPEKMKIEGVAFISKKKLKSHFWDQKNRFFSILYFEKCFYMQFLPTANFSLVWPNFCTPYWQFFEFLLKPNYSEGVWAYMPQREMVLVLYYWIKYTAMWVSFHEKKKNRHLRPPPPPRW